MNECNNAARGSQGHENVVDIFPVPSDPHGGVVIYRSRGELEPTTSEILDLLPVVYDAAPPGERT